MKMKTDEGWLRIKRGDAGYTWSERRLIVEAFFAKFPGEIHITGCFPNFFCNILLNIFITNKKNMAFG